MAKKWTTLRKIDPDKEKGGENAPRTPRRRLQARAESESSPAEKQPLTSRRSKKKQAAQAASESLPAVRPLDVEEPRILVVHDTAATYRLVEETFGNFTKAAVDSTPDILTAFELAIRRDYQLFVIALSLPGISGNLFYELVSRAYATGLSEKKLAPAVVFIREKDEPLPSEDLKGDVRVKAIWSKPLNIELMLNSVSSVIKRCDPIG